MSKTMKATIILFSLAVICTCCVINNSCAFSEKIKIGLFFNSGSISHTAVSQFTVDAQQGVQVGVYKDEQFTKVYQSITGDKLCIRKDIASSGYTKSELANIGCAGEIGPFHVIIGSYSNLQDAKNQVNHLIGKKIDAYIAYVDEWQVWTGGYRDENTAQLAVQNISKAISVTCKVVQPSETCVIVSSSGKDIFAFDSVKSCFRACPNEEGSLNIIRINSDNTKRYRGQLQVCRLAESDMTVINVIDLEDYLKGVLSCEIGASAPIEALKAQAVAARNYALINKGKYSKLGFDLCTTIYTQVYKGVDAEFASTNRAVEQTAGKRLFYKGTLAKTFYFASSGGRTEDVKNVWGSNYPYLVSVDDKYEPESAARHTWQKNFTNENIKDVLTKKGYKNIGNIINMQIEKVSSSGRVIELKISGTTDSITVTKENCRNLLGLYSQWYTITKEPNGTYTLNGRGYGHAVGMSQSGAIGMAKAGFDYVNILTHYFPGTTVE